MALDSAKGIMNYEFWIMICGTVRTDETSGTGGTSETGGTGGTSRTGERIMNCAQATSLRQRGGKKGYEKARKNDPDKNK